MYRALANMSLMQNLRCNGLPHPGNYHHQKPEKSSLKKGLRAHWAPDIPRDAPWYNNCLLAIVETGNEETLEFTSQAQVRTEKTLYVWHHPCCDAHKSRIHIMAP